MERPKMRIFMGTDHAGFELKEAVKKHLLDSGYDVQDMGAHSFDKLDDYPDFIVPAAKKVSENPGSLGIVLGASGQGEALAANKVKGVRAALYYGHEPEIIRLSREHNDANVLSLGARFLKKEEAIKAVDMWLKTGFTNEERHARRLKKVDSI